MVNVSNFETFFPSCDLALQKITLKCAQLHLKHLLPAFEQMPSFETFWNIKQNEYVILIMNLKMCQKQQILYKNTFRYVLYWIMNLQIIIQCNVKIYYSVDFAYKDHLLASFFYLYLPGSTSIIIIMKNNLQKQMVVISGIKSIIVCNIS